jgi:hypothetical protein
MKGWGLVIGLLAAVTVVALALKAVPPGVLVVGALAAGGYGAYRFSRRKKAAKENVEGRALGLQAADGDLFGLAGLPLELLSRGTEGRGVDHVLWGSWETVDVRLFDFRYTSGDEGDRRFTCALMALERDVSPFVVEPKVFFTPLTERGQLSVVEVDDRAFGEAFDVRAGDPKFATGLLDDDTRRWMERRNGIAFEVNGRMLLTYMPRDRRDLLALLEAGAELGRRFAAEPVRPRRTAGSKRPTASKGSTGSGSSKKAASSAKRASPEKALDPGKATAKRTRSGRRSGSRPAPEAPV